MRQPTMMRLLLPALLFALPAGAQNVTIDFHEYASPTTTEYQAAVGAPVTSGGLDFYNATGLDANALNSLGTWGTSDAGSVNRPSNIGTSTTLFATVLGTEVDIYGHGSDLVVGPLNPFSLISLDIAHLYSSAFSPIALVNVNLRFFGFLGSGPVFFQDFLLPAPVAVNGVQTPVLQTLVFDDRFHNVSNVWYIQGAGSGSATQFTNVVTTPEPSSLVLLASGLFGVIGISTRRRHRGRGVSR